MKRVCGLLVFGILVVSSVCYAADAELRLRPYYLIPGVSGNDKGYQK